MKRMSWLFLLACGYGLALSHGNLQTTALASFALLALAALGLRYAPLKVAAHGLFIALAVGLALHWLPGFNNGLVIDNARLEPDATPLTLYLNLDKPLIGFWLLLACPWLLPRSAAPSRCLAGLSALLTLTVVLVLAGALLLGVVAWAPKWPEQGWLWVANNLLLVCIVEELLFRGYVQGGLQRLLQNRPYAQAAVLPGTAVLFGLAHAGGGWEWALLATGAGLGYGLAYRQAGLAGAVLCHFALNLAHFTLFTYPMLAR